MRSGKRRQIGTPKREPKREPTPQRRSPNWVPFWIVFAQLVFCEHLDFVCVFVLSVYCTAFPRAFGAVLSPIWRPKNARTIVKTMGCPCKNATITAWTLGIIVKTSVSTSDQNLCEHNWSHYENTGFCIQECQDHFKNILNHCANHGVCIQDARFIIKQWYLHPRMPESFKKYRYLHSCLKNLLRKPW